jgi:hypothetical protein
MATSIHHSTIKAAEKQGIVLSVDGSIVRAFIPSKAVLAYGVSGKDAIKQVLAAVEIKEYTEGDIKFVPVEGSINGQLEHSSGDLSKQTATPFGLLADLKGNKIEWEGQSDDTMPTVTVEVVDNIEDTLSKDTPFEEDPEPKPVVDDTPVVKRNEHGVPLDGAIAYREGITAADCPFSSEGEDDEEYQRFLDWNDEWDAAADSAEEDNTEGGGSVVKSKYRTKYKEEGHPNHCGDWLAELLNNYCVGEKHTDLITFENICSMNGVDTSKYKREGVGWQGRIRMTGRNLLAKKVYQNRKIIVPEPDRGGTMEIEAPADWLSAQRFSKPEAK